MISTLLAALALVVTFGGGLLYAYLKGKEITSLRRDRDEALQTIKENLNADKVLDDVRNLDDDSLNDELRL